VGFSILEISKFIMYSFYYDHLKAKYADRCTLFFTDTDNLCCEIRTDDLYADMMDSLDLYDTSNFDPKLPQYNDDNRRNSENLRARPDRSLLVSSSACARKCIASTPQQKISIRPKASKSITFENTSGMKISSRSCTKRVETLLQSFARSGQRSTR